MRSSRDERDTRRGVVTIAAALAAMLTLPWLVMQVPGLRREHLLLEQGLVAQLLGYVAVIAIVLGSRTVPRANGFSGIRRGSRIIAGAGCGAALFGSSLAWNALLHTVFRDSGGMGSELLANYNAVLVIPTYGVLTIIIAPTAEELVFRGLLMGTLLRAQSPLLQVSISALAFALVHFNALAFVPNLAGGILFAVLYIRTRTLDAPIAAHVVFNGLAFVGLVAQATAGA